MATLDYGASVTCKGCLTMEPCRIGALVSNNSMKTHISRRLAARLGLTRAKDIFVRDGYGFSKNALKWKISLDPLIIDSPALSTPCIVYPLINGESDDAFFEMVTGIDCKEGMMELLMSTQYNDCQITPGPSYVEGVGIMASMSICSSKELPPSLDHFLEYPCWGSEAVSRIALNKARGQIAAVFRNPSQIYLYSNLPESVNTMIEREPSRGRMMQTIRNLPGVTVGLVSKFPLTALVNFKYDF